MLPRWNFFLFLKISQWIYYLILEEWILESIVLKHIEDICVFFSADCLEHLLLVITLQKNKFLRRDLWKVRSWKTALGPLHTNLIITSKDGGLHTLFYLVGLQLVTWILKVKSEMSLFLVVLLLACSGAILSGSSYYISTYSLLPNRFLNNNLFRCWWGGKKISANIKGNGIERSVFSICSFT